MAMADVSEREDNMEIADAQKFLQENHRASSPFDKETDGRR
jgi:hypothetical protein